MGKVFVKTPEGQTFTRGKDRFDEYNGTPREVVLDKFIRRMIEQGSLILVDSIEIHQDIQQSTIEQP